MALPLLDAMNRSRHSRSPSAKDQPNRLAFVFVPNGMHMADWTPAAEGARLHAAVHHGAAEERPGEAARLTGLTQDKARPNGDGPGDHARSAAAWLTGCQPKKTSGADIKVGISADQLAAQKVATARRSLPSRSAWSAARSPATATRL